MLSILTCKRSEVIVPLAVFCILAEVFTLEGIVILLCGLLDY